MKLSLKSLVDVDRTILDRLDSLANLLPVTGPEPVGISLAQGGCITYLHDPETTPIIGIAFGLTGWRCEIPRGGSYIDLVKRLPNGVCVRVVDVTEVEFDEAVPPEFFTGEMSVPDLDGGDEGDGARHRAAQAMRRARGH